MNRAQRRAAAKAPAPQAKPVTINWGHDGGHVLVRFSQKVDIVHLSPQQAEDAIRMLDAALVDLKAHQALATAEAQR